MTVTGKSFVFTIAMILLDLAMQLLFQQKLKRLKPLILTSRILTSFGSLTLTQGLVPLQVSEAKLEIINLKGPSVKGICNEGMEGHPSVDKGIGIMTSVNVHI